MSIGDNLRWRDTELTHLSGPLNDETLCGKPARGKMTAEKRAKIDCPTCAMLITRVKNYRGGYLRIYPGGPNV